MKRKWHIVFLPVFVLVGILGCNPVDGSDPYALWKIYDHPDGLYHFHYLSPPWEKLTAASSSSQRFVVDVDGVSLESVGLPGDGMESRLSMIVELYRDIPALAAAWSTIGNWIANGAETEQLETFESERGDEGLRIRAEGPDRFITAVFHDLPEWGAVSMTIIGREEVDSADIRLLLESLEPTPAETRRLGL